MSLLFKKVAAQDAGHTELWILGTLNNLNSGRAKNDKGLRDYVRKAWESSKAHNPEMKKFEGTANYKEIERILSQDSCAEDTAEPKVGEKVYWGLSNGIVTSINGNEVTVKTQNGREEKVFVEAIHGIDPKGSFDNSAAIDADEAGDADFVNSEEFKKAGKIVESIWLLIDRNKNAEAAKLFKENEAFIRKYSHAPNYIIEGLKRSALANDSAAMDDLNDGIKTIENKARALIADAKNARSKYAEILARSEIAKNNAQVKKTFEDDIARCDKLINALKAI